MYVTNHITTAGLSALWPKALHRLKPPGLSPTDSPWTYGLDTDTLAVRA